MDRKRTALGLLFVTSIASYVWDCGPWDRVLIAAERARARVSTAEINDGRTWSLNERACGAKECGEVWLLHGIGARKEHFIRFMGELPTNLHAVAVDLPAFGKTTFQASESFGIDEQAERVASLIAKRGTVPVHLLGSSMGGHIAAAIAERHPELVKTLTLIEPHGAGVDTPTQLQSEVRQGRNPLLPHNAEEAEKVMDFVFVEKPWIPIPVERAYQREVTEAHARWYKVFTDVGGPEDARLLARAPRISKPTLILWGDKGNVFAVSRGEALAKLFPHATFEKLSRTGHVPMTERPAETAARFRVFVEKASAP